MRCAQLILPATLLFTTAAFAQPASSDSQLTQALLTEIRQLRQDLQVTAAVIQRAQILMYRLQVETGLLSRATQRLDEARNRCTQSQMQLKNTSARIEQAEARQRTTQNPVELKSIDDLLVQLKSQLAMWTTQEQQCHTQELDAETQSRAAQARVNEFQDQLDRLDKLLAGAAK